MTFVISGSASKSLATEIASFEKVQVIEVETKKFPDNEIYVRIPRKLSGEDCVVIQSTPSNDSLLELFFILDALRDEKVSSIVTFVPYLRYSRQDKQFLAGEAISAKTVLRIIDELSDKIFTVNCHFLDEEGMFNYHGVELWNIDVFPLLGEYFKRKFTDIVVIAPDKGSVKYAKKAAGVIGCEFDYLEKKRISCEEVEIKPKKMNVSDKNVVILDDIISSGGTIINAAEILKQQRAKKVMAGCVHGVFSKGIDHLLSTLDEVVATNTIETPVSKVSIAEYAAKKLFKL